MKKQYHREITIKALGTYFQPEVLEIIITANLGQDALRFQVRHDHFHYDSNSFAAGDIYCEELRALIISSLKIGNVLPARESLGRLTHTVQDLYAHSNYVALWQEIHPGCSPGEIEPELSGLLLDPRLHSGRLYYPLEALTFISALRPRVIPLLPRDSHAWMNIDDPSRPGFEYAFAAAVKRTNAEYLNIISQLSPQEVAHLTGKDDQS
jgi:hypothetical protein